MSCTPSLSNPAGCIMKIQLIHSNRRGGWFFSLGNLPADKTIYKNKRECAKEAVKKLVFLKPKYKGAFAGKRWDQIFQMLRLDI